MNKFRIAAIAVLLMSVVVFFAPEPNAAEPETSGREYVFYLPLSKGLAQGSFSKLMRDIVKTLASVTGIKIKCLQDTYDVGTIVNSMVYEKMSAGEADVSYVNSIEYLEEREKWDKIFRPVFLIQFNGKYYNEYCMYVDRESSVETIGDTRGMVWGGMDTVQTRMVLHDAGIDEPLADFYSARKFIFESPVTNYLEALAQGDIDVFVANKGQMLMSGGVPGSTGKVKSIAFKEIACVEGEHSWIFGFRKNVPKEIVSKVMKNILKAHKLPEFRQFGFLFVAIKGHFAPFKEENLTRTKEIVKLKKEFNWRKEQADFYKTAPERE